MGTEHAEHIEHIEGRVAEVGGAAVRRVLPTKGRRTVGAWCFVDHFGPMVPGRDGPGVQIGPHPHIGLQTVTWLLDGELVHVDSVGSRQPIRPGQLNLMTAGHGVSHAEEPSPAPGAIHGAQLWVAQPEATRHGEPAFEHHAHLPSVATGHLDLTVLLGSFGGVTSPARTDTAIVGVALRGSAAGETTLSLDPAFEHAVVALDGSVRADGDAVPVGELAVLGLGRDQVRIATTGPIDALLLGGEPFGAELFMWWNFVGRTAAEIDQARADWNAGADRFGSVDSSLPRIAAPDR